MFVGTNYHKPYPFRTKGDIPPRFCKTVNLNRNTMKHQSCKCCSANDATFNIIKGIITLEYCTQCVALPAAIADVESDAYANELPSNMKA